MDSVRERKCYHFNDKPIGQAAALVTLQIVKYYFLSVVGRVGSLNLSLQIDRVAHQPIKCNRLC